MQYICHDIGIDKQDKAEK